MKKVAVIGASYLQLPLIKKLKEMGLFSICFAWESGSICKDYCDKYYAISIINKNAILEICREESISGVVSIASDIAVPTVCYIAENLGLTGNSVNSSIISTNKYFQRNTLRNANINVPRFKKFNAECSNILVDLNFPVIIKPVDRSGSKGITALKSHHNFHKSVQYAQNESLCGDVIVEEFIEGMEISIEAISYQGNHRIIAFTDKVTSGYPHFVELEHHEPSIFWNSPLHSKVEAIVLASLNALEILYGASHTELIVTREGEIFVTEVGSRMGGDFIGSHLVQLSTGFDFLKSVIEVSLGVKPVIEIDHYAHAGICFYTEETKWVSDFIKSKNPGIIDFHIEDLKNVKLKESSERSGYFIYSGNEKIDYQYYQQKFQIKE